MPTAASGDDGVDQNRLTGSCQSKPRSELKRPRAEIITRLPVHCLVKTKLIENAEQVEQLGQLKLKSDIPYIF